MGVTAIKLPPAVIVLGLNVTKKGGGGVSSFPALPTPVQQLLLLKMRRGKKVKHVHTSTQNHRKPSSQSPLWQMKKQLHHRKLDVAGTREDHGMQKILKGDKKKSIPILPKVCK